MNLTWKPVTTERTAHSLPRDVVLAAADKVGIVTINASALGAAAGVSHRAAARWLAGTPVAPATDLALRKALGLT